MKNNSCIRIKANIEQIANCKQTILAFEDSFDLLSNALNLAGNNVRLKILYLLSQEQELCVCDLSDILSMNISAISQHLRKLKDRKIIKPQRKAQTIYYSLTPKYNTIFLPFFKLIDGNKYWKLFNKTIMNIKLKSTITCPNCGYKKEEEMPTNSCQFFYECEQCKTILKPNKGDCCVYCSFGSVPCPSIQEKNDCNNNNCC